VFWQIRQCFGSAINRSAFGSEMGVLVGVAVRIQRPFSKNT
jgi:hypothetical protein